MLKGSIYRVIQRNMEVSRLAVSQMYVRSFAEITTAIQDRRMARITLFRHGKAEEPTQQLADFDRGLTSRGIANARKMGEFLRDQHMLPDLVLVSTAKRTRQTHASASTTWHDIPTEFVDGIYEATASALLLLVAERAANVKNVLILGHNPSLVVLLNHMVGFDNADSNLSYFPTCCVADVGFADPTLGTINPEDGRLLSMMRVRDLPH